MTALVTALYAEGRTDERFLPRIIQRAAADLLSRRSSRIVDVLEPTVVNPDERSTRRENIVAVARKAAGYHALFIHADADASTRDRAYNERFEPGMTLVRAAHSAEEIICTDLIPVIPVQAVESWLLADADALHAVIGSNVSSRDLGMPMAPQEIERIANPKQRLTEIVRQAISIRSRRRPNLNIGELHEPLADQIRLDRLSRLSAFQQFYDDLATLLERLGFLT